MTNLIMNLLNNLSAMMDNAPMSFTLLVVLDFVLAIVLVSIAVIRIIRNHIKEERTYKARKALASCSTMGEWVNIPYANCKARRIGNKYEIRPNLKRGRKESYWNWQSRKDSCTTTWDCFDYAFQVVERSI